MVWVRRPHCIPQERATCERYLKYVLLSCLHRIEESRYTLREIRACAFVEDDEKLLSVLVGTVTVYAKGDERTDADVQPEAP